MWELCVLRYIVSLLSVIADTQHTRSTRFGWYNYIIMHSTAYTV